jgi:hypothetical protein
MGNDPKPFRTDNPAFFPPMPRLLYSLGWARMFRAACRAVGRAEILAKPHWRFKRARRKRVLLYGAGLSQDRLARLVALGRAIKAVKPTVNILTVVDASLVPQGQKEPTSSLFALPSYGVTQDDVTFATAAAGGLRLSLERQRNTRIDLLLTTLYSFQPHVVVTGAPGFGPHDEFLPSIEYLTDLRSAPARLCLATSQALVDRLPSKVEMGDTCSVFDLLLLESGEPFERAQGVVPRTFASRVLPIGDATCCDGELEINFGARGEEFDPTLVRAALATRLCLHRRSGWQRLFGDRLDTSIDSLLDGIRRGDDPDIFPEMERL